LKFLTNSKLFLKNYTNYIHHTEWIIIMYMKKIGIDVLTEAATNYTAYDFFVNRQKIG